MIAGMNVCRVCLGAKPRKDISELEPPDFASKSQENMMMFCLGIQVVLNSKVSTKLCVKCFRKIIQFHQFKTLALKNDKYLKSLEVEDLCNEVFIEDSVKTEMVPLESDSVTESPVGNTLNIKEECTECTQEEYKEDYPSDDEYLSVIKKIKYEFINENIENEPVAIKKQKGRPKKQRRKLIYESLLKVCDECGKSVKNLREHMRRHLPAEQKKQIKCEICEKVFATNNGRKKHMIRKHLSVKKQCNICNKSVQNLQMHIQSIHNPETQKFQCIACGRRFMTQARLNTHISVHTKDRPYECDICDAKFRLKLSMSMHKRQVHEKEKSHLCQYCSKRFFKKHHLQLHLRSHTKERPHKCEECGKCYSSTTVLKNHRLTHSNVKKFNCTLCDMTFATPNYLRAHMISHLKEKRYPCQYCGVKFHRSDHRKRHEYTAHLKYTSQTTTANAGA